MKTEIEYLKEHLYEIYKYKKSMQNLTYDMDIEHLSRTCKALDYSQKEIERLHSIIKEVREYCDKEIGNIIAYFDYVDTKDLENIKKILDKVEENK